MLFLFLRLFTFIINLYLKLSVHNEKQLVYSYGSRSLCGCSTLEMLSLCLFFNNSFLALPHPGLAIYRNCMQLESNLASIGDKDGLVNVRKLYESALTTYSQNLSLWQDFYKLETKVSFPLQAMDKCSRLWYTIQFILKR